MKNLCSVSCKLIISFGLFWIELLYYYVTSNFFTCAANIAPFQNLEICTSLARYDMSRGGSTMAIWVVEFSNGGYKIRKIFA